MPEVLKSLTAAIVGLGSVWGSGAAAAPVVVDLTTAGSSGSIGAAQFYQYSSPHPSGSGVFEPFVRIQEDGTESGYNTDGTLEFDTKSGVWTHAVKVSDIPIVNDYLQFALDINEASSKDNPWLSLDNVQLFVTADPNLTDYATFSTTPPTKLVYDMDASDVGNTVLLDYSLSASGSGRADMLMYVAAKLFEDYIGQYLVLYSEFGGAGYAPAETSDGDNYASGSGYEEWSFNSNINAPPSSAPPIVPLPAALPLLLGALAIFGFAGWWRKRSAA